MCTAPPGSLAYGAKRLFTWATPTNPGPEATAVSIQSSPTSPGRIELSCCFFMLEILGNIESIRFVFESLVYRCCWYYSKALDIHIFMPYMCVQFSLRIHLSRYKDESRYENFNCLPMSSLMYVYFLVTEVWAVRTLAARAPGRAGQAWRTTPAQRTSHRTASTPWTPANPKFTGHTTVFIHMYIY